MFELHPRLAADTAPVAELPLCSVRLMEDADFPWLILVPRVPGMRELHHLADADRHALLAEVVRASEVLERLFRPDKLNIGALGNLVPQLHVHVVARWQTDRAWPGPVWGSGPAKPYEATARDEVLARLAAALAG